MTWPPEGFTLLDLAAKGGIGLMNTRTGGGLTAENAYASIGGGARSGGAHAKLALSKRAVYKEKSEGDIYRRRTGWDLPGSILVLDIENIANNLASGNIQLVGLIGETLREAQLNAVDRQRRHPGVPRWAALIAMDSRGQIPIGSVDPSSIHWIGATGRRPIFQLCGRNTCSAGQRRLLW